MSKQKTLNADQEIAKLKAQLRQLEQVRADQVEELLSQLQTAMSDTAELLVRCAGMKGSDDDA